MDVGFLPSVTPFGIAHRGGSGHAPENTPAAFRNATELGYTHLETDVHATRDGVVVAFHDADLKRMFGVEGQIGDYEWADLSQMTLDDGHSIPRFQDLLDALPDSRFVVDPKADDAVEPLCRLVEQNGATHRLCIGAFSDARIQRARELLGPDLCTSPGPRQFARLMARLRLGRLPDVVHQCVQIPTTVGGLRLDKPWVIEGFKKAGLQVHFWTINDGDEMDRLLAMGADAIISDNLETLRSVLDQRI